jgi:hypothetical protein
MKIIYFLFLLNGIGMAVIWTKDILANREIDLSNGFFSAREQHSANLFWPHWFAEYITAILLIFSAVLIFLKINLGTQLISFGAGALFYTSLNSLGWALSKKERSIYAVPMLFALLVCVVYFILLLQ